MICPKCDQEYTDVCVCGYASRTLAPVAQPSNWLVRRCTAHGCSVMVRESIHDHSINPYCKWHLASKAYNSVEIDIRPNVGEPLSKEEFGLDLFEAIRVQSAMRQAERTADTYTMKGLKHRAEDCQLKIKSLQRELDTILSRNTIESHDLKRILAIR